KVKVLGTSFVPEMRSKLGSAFTVSSDGMRVRFGLGFGEAQPVVFDVGMGTISNAPDALPDLLPAVIRGLDIDDWQDQFEPTLDGKVLPLKQLERSRSLAVRDDRRGFVLGTVWYLRAFSDNGKQQWELPGPSVAWGVNFAREGRLIVVAYGDGT